jgi:hypothetical protein
MKPTITNVTEQNVLGRNGQITKAVVVTYKVGGYGPFTLTTTQADLAAGTALQQMQAFANTLAALPTT